MVRAMALLLLALAAAGCVRRGPAVAPSPHYLVGNGYQNAGTWFYPREDFHYDATGLAVMQPAGHGLTANGEAIDAGSMTASHQTLQLPAIVRVTNFETGLQVLVRVNDRGPAQPSRLIGLSRRAAELLGIPPGHVAPVRVQVEEGPSVALREQLQGGPRLALAAVPRGAVQSESLAPPPGVGQSTRGRGPSAVQPAGLSAVAAGAAVPDRLPEVAQRVAVAPGQLMIDAGSFGRMAYAAQVQARLSGLGTRVRRVTEGRTERYTVIAGPFPNAAAADAALDQALRSGVTDARIVVE